MWVSSDRILHKNALFDAESPFVTRTQSLAETEENDANYTSAEMKLNGNVYNMYNRWLAGVTRAQIEQNQA